ncbi:MAG TPA: DAK2 domain-containing protein [Mycobacterium sp.]|nr:DAK2 domain-containing protein [Mycobacterium sp.]
MSGRRLDASGLLDWAHAAVGGLVVHAEEINRLNVFPVPDSDTGTNMLFTMRAALADAQRRAKKSGDVSRVAAALARGALHGARGNSGVILSQILRGLADVTKSAAADTRNQLAEIDATLFGAALRHGVVLVVGSMGEEVPGTIVSVLHAAATTAEHCAADGDSLSDTVLATADAAVAALERTPDQLAVLAECGVVDAGGRGLLVLLDALAATLTGHTPVRSEYVPSPAVADPVALSADADARPPHYEVMYQISGSDQRLDALRQRLEELGDSVAIAGDGGERYSVHVHADDAGAAVEAALAVGTPSNIQISTLRGGAAPGRWTRKRAVLAVVDGEGAGQLFAAEGAHILRCDGNNPDAVTAKELTRAVVDTGAGQVVVLPNGYVAVEELVAGCTAATGWGLDVVPVPTGSMVQGLAALAVHESGRSAVDDGYAMAQAAGATRHGSVRVATEQALTWAGPCEPGDGLGIVGDEVLVVHPEIAVTACGLLDLLLTVGGEMVTVLIGAGIDDGVGADLEAHVHRYHPGTELVTYQTGHHGDALLIGVE